MAEINPFVVFEVKLDKDRGIIVLTIRKYELEDVWFFRFHHQPLKCHPEQLQQVIRSHNITSRTKSVKVNIFGYLSHYWNEEDKCFQFKGVKLNSSKHQLAKAQNCKINKEIASLKRKEAVRTNQQLKLKDLKEKNEKLEEEFQLERAKRIKEAKAEIDNKKLEKM